MLSSVIGHEQLKEKLSIRLKEHPAGVFLFCGPASIGKRTTAFEAAKYILCEDKSEEKCSCQSCKRFKSEHPDFLCVGRHEKIKVHDVDSIINFSSTAPLISDYKVVVLDNAHEITPEAANRLLKRLEEPPPKFTFILVTSNPQYLIPTVLSRCIKYEFGNLNRDELTTIIRKKLGFSSKKSEVLGLLAVDSSLDVFKNAGHYLKYRKMAVEFLSEIKSRSLIDSLDYVDKIEKEDIPIFIDMMMLLLTDFLLLKNNIPEITNKDMEEDLIKIAKHINDKALIGVVGMFSQIKRYLYLNINLNLYLKNAVIKSYPYFMADV
jgi:DNA polymerase-3 subunit delta'